LSIGRGYPGIATTKGAAASTNQQQTGNKLNQRRHSQWLLQLTPAVCGFFLLFQRSSGSLFADQDGLSIAREAYFIAQLHRDVSQHLASLDHHFLLKCHAWSVREPGAY
jgi:hypothetical protein